MEKGKTLILLRGLPGSGKSTTAKLLGADGAGCAHFEADMYFMEDGKYKFDPMKIKDAHKWCQNSVEHAMLLNHTTGHNSTIIVSNTFTQEWEMEQYYKMAESWGYRVYSIIVENRHGGVNEHGVPEEKLEQMKNRFEIKL
jgi:tRNA uridine 5-carbamoylmethylation protein Kti12